MPLLTFSAAYRYTGSLVFGFLIMAFFFASGSFFFSGVDMEAARRQVQESGTLDVRTANATAGLGSALADPQEADPEQPGDGHTKSGKKKQQGKS